MNILDFSREQVKAMAQSGLMNIKSASHWDICKALSEGKTLEQVADMFRMGFNTVRHVKAKKCDCR